MDPRPASDGFSDPLQVLKRAVIVVLVDAVVLWILAGILDRFTLDGFGAAIGAALLIGVLNALVFPTLARLTLPLNVVTLGVAAIVINSILVAFAIDLVPNAEIQGLGEAILVTIALTLATSATSALLAIDDDESWYRNVVRAEARGRDKSNRTNVPGVLFLEIDGLAHEVLQRAIASGRCPNIARWIEDGSHDLHRWETDWSSQTGACQAGLLHGNNEDMPAFRWWEKERNAPIVTNHPKDAVEIERRQSNGRGLLYADGASRANILSGDAVHSMLTMSTVLTRRRPIGRDYAAYFARPYATFKTLNAVIAEYFRERWAAIGQKRRDERPRIDRDRKYGLVRAWATVIQLDLQVAAVVGDLLAGRPVVYTTFLAYDEVAHHSGIEREDTLAVLEKVDRQVGRIEKATAEAPRPYRLIVLSDHGQSQGATFLQRYGYTLEDLVTKACNSGSAYVGSEGSAEASAYMGASLTELDRDQTPITRVLQTGAEKLHIAHPAEGNVKQPPVDEPPGAGRDGVGLPRADQLPARARAGDPGADRGPLPHPDRGAARPRRDRVPARRLRERRGPRHRCRGRQPARKGRDPRQGPARGVRPERRPPRPPHAPLPALSRHRRQQPDLARPARGRRLRGARRLARRHGRLAELPLRARPLRSRMARRRADRR